VRIQCSVVMHQWRAYQVANVVLYPVWTCVRNDADCSSCHLSGRQNVCRSMCGYPGSSTGIRTRTSHSLCIEADKESVLFHSLVAASLLYGFIHLGGSVLCKVDELAFANRALRYC